MRVKIALFALLSLQMLAACERPPASQAQPPVEPPQAAAPPSSDEDAPATAGASSSALKAASLEASVGLACALDSGCPDYLRCVERRCVVPSAISGVRDERTPEVRFFATREAQGEPLASFHVELATDDAQRSRGLMFRRTMLPDWGMLFIYDHDAPLSFWMKNTYIPLDMVFIHSSGEVNGVVEGADPLTLSPRSVPGVSRYVLELKAGTASQVGIRKGTHMRIERVREDYMPTP